MRKNWLIAGVLACGAAMAHAAEVRIFGVNTPSLGRWAVYGQITNTTSTVSGQVAGLSSIVIDVLNNGTSTVSTATNTLPTGTTPYTDSTFTPNNVNYGFWLFRSNGTNPSDARHNTGLYEIRGAQNPFPSTTVPYQKLVIPGVGITAGSVAVDADHTSATQWGYPIQIATGTYTPSSSTSAVGLKMQYSVDSSVDLVRGSAAAGWAVEAAVNPTVADARRFTAIPFNSGSYTDGFMVKAGQGDANLDGLVNFDDLVAVAQNYDRTNATWFDGDFNYDGKVDFEDLVLVAQNYDQPVASPVAAAQFNEDLAQAFASVPEPGTFGMAALVGTVWALRRRRI